jgi:TrmH family RNA methyltransferase
MLEGENVTTMKKPPEGVLLIGNESKGISKELMQWVNVKITIPQKGKAESLNAAVACGIILSHIS